MPDGLSMRKVRAVSGAADQIFSSMSNGLIIYAVAVVTAPERFGQIALLLTLLAAAIGILRGALGTPLLLTAARDRSDIRREGSFAVTSALLASPIVGGIMWAVEGAGISPPALLIIAATPIVLVGDMLRYVAIAEGRPHVAALWDGVWFAGSAALLTATWLHSPVATAVDLIGGWAAMALIALVGLLIGVRVTPRFKELRTWIANGWQHRARYGTESGLEQTTAFAVLLFAALVLSPGVTAALRGATALLAPLAILTSAIPLVVIPDSRRHNMSPPQVWKSLARIASASSSGAILIGAGLYFLPGTVGEFVLGRTFREAQAITPIIAFEYAVGSWIIAVTIHLRTFNRSADALRLKAGYVLLMIMTALGGGMLFRTAAGVAVGIATATTFITAMSLFLFKPWAGVGGDTTTPADLEPAAPDPLRAVRAGQGVAREEAGIVAAYRHLKSAVPGPVPAAVKLRLHGRVQSSDALITLWAFAIMAVFVPAAIIRFTGVPASPLWLWSLPGVAISAARFAWLLGNGERRLFEVMFWGYSYAFLGLAPLVQLRENNFPDTVPRVDVAYTAAAALIVIVGCGAFLAGAGLDNATKLGRSWRAARRSRDVAPAFSVNNARLVLLCGFAVVANMYYCSKVGWILFVKSRTDALNIESNAWGETNVGVIMRSCSCMALLVAFIALMRFRKEAKLANRGDEKVSSTVMRGNLVLLVVVGLLLANAMNPISNARYLAGTAILAAATAFGLFATTRRFRATSCGFLVGLLVIFPLADAFRVSTQAELKATNPIASLLSPDYDSFAELMNGYLVGAQQGIVPGKQFSGVLLFWLPRTMWTEKPVDTGIYIANVRGYPFTNLSAPLWIEMYLNGGWIPLAAGMFVLGYALHRWDTRLDNEFDVYRMPGLIGCILPFYMMILLRGSLLQAASFLFFIGVFATFVRERKVKTRPGVPAVPREPRPARGAELVRTNYVGA